MSSNAVLLIPLVAFAAAYESPDSQRPIVLAEARSATKKAIRLANDASAQRRGELHVVDVSDAAAERATDAVLRSKAWREALHEASERAGGAAITDDLELRSFAGPTGTLTRVEAVLFSGEGYTLCGDDYVARVMGIVDDTGRVVVPFVRVEDATDGGCP